PGIVPIVDQGLHEGVPWYAMELIAGHTLRGHTDAALATQMLSGPAAVAWWTQTLATDADASGLAPRSGGQAPPVEPAACARPRTDGPGVLRALTLVRRLCEPLGFLHAEGIVHRDL